MKKKSILIIFILFISICYGALPVWAVTTTYYFSLDGDDNNACTPNWANRCKTIERANEIAEDISDVTDGNEVRLLFNYNDVWDNYATEFTSAVATATYDKFLNVAVSGANDTSRVIVGVCDGSGNYVSGESANKATIDNTGLTQVLYRGAVRVYSQSWVTVENLNLPGTAGDTVYADGLRAEQSDGINFLYNTIADTDCAGIRIVKCTGGNGGLVKGNTVDGTGVSASCSPAGITLTSSYGFTVEDNTVSNLVDREGIGIYRNYGSAGSNIVQDNIVYDTEVVGIYVANGGPNNIIRRNIVYSVDETDMGGVQIRDETADCGLGISTNTTISENFISVTNAGLQITNQCSAEMSGNVFYNNTVVRGGTYATGNVREFVVRVALSAGSITGLEFKYNYFNDTVADIAETPSGHTWDYNIWSAAEAAIDADARGANDTYEIPLAGNIYKNSGWDSITDGSQTGANFALVAGSTLINASPITRTIVDPDSVWPSAVITMSANEVGGMGFVDAPPEQGDSGLYGVIGGTGVIIHGDVQSVIPSND